MEDVNFSAIKIRNLLFPELPEPDRRVHPQEVALSYDGQPEGGARRQPQSRRVPPGQHQTVEEESGQTHQEERQDHGCLLV